MVREGGKWLCGAGESAGAGRSEEQVADEKIAVNAMIQEGNWYITGAIAAGIMTETIKELARGLYVQPGALIAHCLVAQEKQPGIYAIRLRTGCRDELSANWKNF